MPAGLELSKSAPAHLGKHPHADITLEILDELFECAWMRREKLNLVASLVVTGL